MLTNGGLFWVLSTLPRIGALLTAMATTVACGLTDAELTARERGSPDAEPGPPNPLPKPDPSLDGPPATEVEPDADPGAPPPGLKVYATGNAAWVDRVPTGRITLMGGGRENDPAMRWFLDGAQGGDVVVLRARGSNGYNDYMYRELGGVDSVHTLVVSSRAQADSFYVAQTVRNAEALWLAGGNQGTYYTRWSGTQLEAALDYLLAVKKASIGGTSAGMAVLGEVDYAALAGSVTSTEALGNPFHADVTLTDDFLSPMPFMAGVITDTHWSERGRLGRTLAFMARMVTDGLGSKAAGARGLSADEQTAVAIDPQGLARVYGNAAYDDFAYFFDCPQAPERCRPGRSLHWSAGCRVFQAKGYPDGRVTLDLNDWATSQTQGCPECGWRTVSVEQGRVLNDIQTPN